MDQTTIRYMSDITWKSDETELIKSDGSKSYSCACITYIKYEDTMILYDKLDTGR